MKRGISGVLRSPVAYLALLAVAQGLLFGSSRMARWTAAGLTVFALLPLACVLTGRTRRERLAGLLPCAAVWALLVFSARFGFASVAVLLSLGALLLFAALRLWRRGEMTWERAAALLLFAAVALRLAYVLGTPYTWRQHDVEGHEDYIVYLVENNLRLPALSYDPRTLSQLYHPPLHHLISAIWVKVQMFFGASLQQGLEGVQALTLLWSNLALLFSWRLFRELSLRGSGLLTACAIAGFLPIFVFGAAGVNNDALLYMLQMALILTAVRWWRRPAAGRCALMGLLLGLSMATKLSGALLAVPLAVMFLAALIQRRAPMKALWGQYALFLLLSVPIGFAYPVYNLLRWGMPLTYVQRLAEDSPQRLYGYSPLSRLFGVSGAQLRNIYLNFNDPAVQDSNVFLALLKSIAFDDYAIVSPDSRFAWLVVVPVGVYALVIATALYALFCGLRTAVRWVRRRAVSLVSAFLLLVCVVLMASYIQFCFAYPFVCTQHARYILPVLAIAAACVGKGRGGRLRMALAGGLPVFSAAMFAFLIAYTEIAL